MFNILCRQFLLLTNPMELQIFGTMSSYITFLPCHWQFKAACLFLYMFFQLSSAVKMNVFYVQREVRFIGFHIVGKTSFCLVSSRISLILFSWIALIMI